MLKCQNQQTIDSTFLILTASKGVTDTGYCPAITYGDIKLYENNILIDSLKYDEILEHYFTPFHYFADGKNYKIMANVPNFTSIVAEDIMPQKPPITSLTITPNVRRMNIDQNNNTCMMKFHLQYVTTQTLKIFMPLI